MCVCAGCRSHNRKPVAQRATTCMLVSCNGATAYIVLSCGVTTIVMHVLRARACIQSLCGWIMSPSMYHFQRYDRRLHAERSLASLYSGDNLAQRAPRRGLRAGHSDSSSNWPRTTYRRRSKVLRGQDPFPGASEGTVHPLDCARCMCLPKCVRLLQLGALGVSSRWWTRAALGVPATVECGARTSTTSSCGG